MVAGWEEGQAQSSESSGLGTFELGSQAIPFSTPRPCLAAPTELMDLPVTSPALPSLVSIHLHLDDEADKCHRSLTGPCACHSTGHHGGAGQKFWPQSPEGTCHVTEEAKTGSSTHTSVAQGSPEAAAAGCPGNEGY